MRPKIDDLSAVPVPGLGDWHGERQADQKVARNLRLGRGRGEAAKLQPGELLVTVSLKDATERFIADGTGRNLSADTLYKYRLLFKGMHEALVDNLRGITTDDLARFRERWDMSPISARKRLERMKAFFRFCQERGWIAGNPAFPLKPPKGKPMPTLPYSEEEAIRIIEACDRFPNKGIYSFNSGARVKAFVLVLLNTGLRIRDAVMLTRDRFEGHRLRLWTQKTGVHVHLPLKPEVVEAVMMACGENGRPFWSGNGLPKSCVADWQRSLRKLFKLAGVEHGHAHRFRDTFSVRLLAKGVPVETVATILGNSPAIVLKHYAPWVKERQLALEEAVMRIW
jgi:integrase